MIRDVVIVGGGSTGWMAAAYLKKYLGSTRVTLIESPAIPTVGVGESTNPITRRFHEGLGIRERDFMVATDATYKMAIRFEDFRSIGTSFYHPFGHANLDCLGKPEADRYYATSFFSDWGIFGDVHLYGGSYGYHIDSCLYGSLLRDYAISHEVQHKIETVDDILVDSSGCIVKVNGVEGDLFIDCTGFRSALLSQALKVPFLSMGSNLLNDRAVAASVLYENRKEEMVPYTRCTALSAGWVWDIPLWSRRGVGYVYSSSFLDEKAAEDELLEFIGSSRRVMHRRHIQIRHGRHISPWVGNCIGLGLAWGFIEPLESTGLALTQLSIMDLVKFLDDPISYNDRTKRIFDTTVDFVLAHYILTDRRDTTYWEQMGDRCTDSLRDLLANPNRCLESISQEVDKYYEASNWNCVLSGMGYWGRNQRMGYLNEQPILNESFLTHEEYVARMREGGK